MLLSLASVYPFGTRPQRPTHPAKATILVCGIYFWGETTSDANISLRTLIPVYCPERPPFDSGLQGSWVGSRSQLHHECTSIHFRPRIRTGFGRWEGLTSSFVFFGMERDVLCLLKIDEELVAVEATLCWWGRRLVGWGQRKDRAWAPTPQYPQPHGCPGPEEKRILCAFQGPPWGPSWGRTHHKPLGCIFGRTSASVAALRKHLILGSTGRRKRCGLLEGLGPLLASRCWCYPCAALVYPDGFPASRETHLPL